MKKKKIQIKKCTLKDSKFVYNLYNRFVKKKLFNKHTIVTFKSHQEWLKNILKSKESAIYIGFSNTRFGYVRIENLFDNIFVVSIAVDEKYIGKGYSNNFLNLSIKKFFKKRKNFILFSFVKKNNLRSKIFFLNNNFFEIKMNNKNRLNKFIKHDNTIFIYLEKISLKKK
jgi:hypothetical protein